MFEQLKEYLKFSIACVTFTKADGSERVMECTLNPSFLPVKEESEKTTKAKNPNVLNVFDTQKHAWRSFRADSLKSWHPVVA